jgi:hypothetical protein
MAGRDVHSVEPDESTGEVRMLRPASSMQRVVDLLRVGRRTSLMLRPARLAAVVVCGLAVFLLVGVTSASAYWPSVIEEAEAEAHEEYFSKQTNPIEERTEECSHEVCHNGKFIVPPGWYLISRNAGFDAIRVHEIGEYECRNPETGEECFITIMNDPKNLQSI